MRSNTAILGMISLLWLYGGCTEDQPEPARRTRPAPDQAAATFVTTGSTTAESDVTQTSQASMPAANAEPSGLPASIPVIDTSQDVVTGFTPLQDAAVGERTSYLDIEGRRLIYEIQDVGATEILTRVSLIDRAGHPIGEPATRRDRRDVDPLARQAARTQATRSAAPAAMEAAGRKWKATLYEDRWVDEEIAYVRLSWVSPDVPVFGLIRMELTGNGKLEAKLELQKDLARPEGAGPRK